MLTGEQLRAARAMLSWEQAELAEKADVSLKTIKRMEATSGNIDARSTWAVRKALEVGGIEFLDGEGDWRTRGDGVRFYKDPTAKLRRLIVDEMTTRLDVSLKIASEKDDDFFERPIDDVVETIISELRNDTKENLQRILRRDA
jgi:transcriptional regulator with XRE-family HTH domain